MFADGRVSTFCGHQNQRPSIAAADGILNERTIRCRTAAPARWWCHLSDHEQVADDGGGHGEGEHQARERHDLAGTAIARMMPVFRPACLSS